MVVVIDPVVADRSADATDIADVVDVGDALEVVAVAYGAAFLGAGRDPTRDTVKLLADSAVRPAKFLLIALGAYRRNHFLIGSNEKLELVPPEALVLFLEHLQVHLLRGDVLALEVVLVKGLEGLDGVPALRWVVGAEEVDFDVWDGFNIEGCTAPVGTSVEDLP